MNFIQFDNQKIVIELSYFYSRKDIQSMGTMETTLLYIVHWFLLDAAEECADSNAFEPVNPFFYIFSIPTMTVSCDEIKFIRRSNLFDSGYNKKLITPRSFSCICSHRSITIWKISISNRISGWKTAWKYGLLCVIVGILMHSVLRHNAVQNHEHFGIVHWNQWNSNNSNNNPTMFSQEQVNMNPPINIIFILRYTKYDHILNANRISFQRRTARQTHT